MAGVGVAVQRRQRLDLPLERVGAPGRVGGGAARGREGRLELGDAGRGRAAVLVRRRARALEVRFEVGQLLRRCVGGGRGVLELAFQGRRALGLFGGRARGGREPGVQVRDLELEGGDGV